ncbi:hypothetical protein JVX93_15825 [Mycolicibacterium boenickei]|nr:hypothetical protein JVX93_15825 [Mycolicibacterium boenickei]
MSDFAVMGDWLAQTINQCTCYGGEFGHERGCGYEPVAKVEEVKAALKAAGLGVIELPSVAHKGPHDTDAKFFRQVADRIEDGGGRELGGSNVRQAVRDLLYRAADAAEPAQCSERPEPCPEWQPVRDSPVGLVGEVES